MSKPINNYSEDLIRVTEKDFSIKDEYDALIDNNSSDGAVVFFVGLVRDFNQGEKIETLFLEHYPKMTEKSLRAIVTEARAKWPLGRVRLVHRVGHLHTNDQIVFVGVSSSHREESFAAAQFIMDYLKTEAPFWKKELTVDGKSRWVDAEEKNQAARDSWGE